MYALIEQYFIQPFQVSLTPQVIEYLTFLLPLVLVFVLGDSFWHMWVRYIRAKFYNSLKYALLEIRLPKEMFKSPLAMETVLHSIHNTSNGSTYAQFWKGEYRPYYSLEIISVEGQVKFLVWTEDRRKSNLLSALYSQYPGIEIVEHQDYTKSVQFDPKKVRVHAIEFAFTKPDPYPIKTYVDYGLDKDPKEEFKVDPLTHMLEWLGSLRPNEQGWFQFIVQAHIKAQRKPGHWWKKTDLWHDQAEEEVNKILIRDRKTKTSAGEPDPETGYTRLAMISKGEQEIVAAIERSVTKLPFDVCVRTLYISPKETFDTPFGIGGMISSMKQFNSESLNGFKPNSKRWHTKLGDPWQDFNNMRRNGFGNKALKAYRRRSAFYPPYVAPTLVLNTEELATIFHLPGGVAATPGLARVPSKKAEAPSNLPI
jgi:hypothetical protein